MIYDRRRKLYSRNEIFTGMHAMSLELWGMHKYSGDRGTGSVVVKSIGEDARLSRGRRREFGRLVFLSKQHAAQLRFFFGGTETFERRRLGEWGESGTRCARYGSG